MSDPGWFVQAFEAFRFSISRFEDHSFDRVSTVQHPRHVVKVVQRLAAVALTFGLMAGNAAVCAGWLPTAEARLACCADGVECPMHKGDSHRSGSERILTQVQADSCCASSEGKKSNQSNPSFVTAIRAAVLRRRRWWW